MNFFIKILITILSILPLLGSNLSTLQGEIKLVNFNPEIFNPSMKKVSVSKRIKKSKQLSTKKSTRVSKSFTKKIKNKQLEKNTSFEFSTLDLNKIQNNEISTERFISSNQLHELANNKGYRSKSIPNLNYSSNRMRDQRDNFGYEYFQEDSEFDWVILEEADTIVLDDDAGKYVPLPGDFPFYENRNNLIGISSNGWLHLPPSNGDTLGLGYEGLGYIWSEPLPSNSVDEIPGSIIAPYATDGFGGYIENFFGEVTYGQNEDSFIVTWHNWGFCCNETRQYDMQVILYENGDFTIQYNNVDFSDQGVYETFYTIGMQNEAKTDGITVMSNDAFANIYSGMRFSFEFPDNEDDSTFTGGLEIRFMDIDSLYDAYGDVFASLGTGCEECLGNIRDMEQFDIVNISDRENFRDWAEQYQFGDFYFQFIDENRNGFHDFGEIYALSCENGMSTDSWEGGNMTVAYEGQVFWLDYYDFWLEAYDFEFYDMDNEPTEEFGFTYLGESNGHFYYASDSGTTWLDAYHFTDTLDIGDSASIHLVTITSQEENNLIQSFSDSLASNSYWIGFTDNYEEGVWEWVSGEDPIYTNWDTGEPNNSGDNGEHFAEISISTGLWNDQSYQLRPFIIELEFFNDNENIYFEKLDYADVTDPTNWDMVTPSVAITRGDNGALFNPYYEEYYNNEISPEGTLWSYGYTGEIAGEHEVEMNQDMYSPLEMAYFNGADTGFNSIVGKTLSMHCLAENRFFDVTFESWTNGGGNGGGGGGFSYTRMEVEPPVNPNTEVDVTFNVDMQFETLDRGVFLAGGDAGNPGYEMFDEDGDHIYSVTLTLESGQPFGYKFVNGPIDENWQGGWEEVPAECGFGEYLDRQIIVGDMDMNLPPVVFGTCHPDGGPEYVFFEKLDYADVTDPANWDMVTPSIAITRGDNQGLFNPYFDESYNGSGPTGTLWAFNTTEYAFLNSLAYVEWVSAVNNNPSSLVGQIISLWCIEENKYFDISFHSWTEGNNGGGFSYTRMEVEPPVNPNTEVDVTFNVDMQFETLDRGVFLAGGDAGNPGYEMFDEDGDHIYSVTLTLESGQPFGYKFVNGPIDENWQGGWEEVPAECGFGEYLDRQIIVGDMDMNLPPVVFGTCHPAMDEVDVTFQVDLQFETVGNGIFLAGGDAGNPGYEMFDEDGDHIYSITLSLPINERFIYKFANGPINPDGIGDFEEVPVECAFGEYYDRAVDVGVQPMNLPPVVFGSCTPEGVVLVTFSVDMQTEDVDPDRGVWLAGGNAGNPGYPMTFLDIPGIERIYSATIAIEAGIAFLYKFSNGPINPDWSGDWEEVPAECGFGDYSDRQIIVGDMDMVLPTVGFGSCDPVPFPSASITNILDIPEDQGGRVYIRFEKSRLDTDEPQRTEMYTIERLDGEVWVGLNSVGAYGSPYYTVEVTTLGDSTSQNQMVSTFRVIANMDEGIFISEPYSGYSVDNIAPGRLTGLIADHSNGMVNLNWDASNVNDFSHYNIYYGSSSDFIPSSETLIGSHSDSNFEHDAIEIGDHYYVVSAVDIHENESEYSEVASITLLNLIDVNGIPEAYTLHQNYPNPFNPTTTLRYDLPEDSHVSIVIFDMMGRQVQTLVSDYKLAGYHSLQWDATNKYGAPVSAGVYIYSIQARNHRDLKKMILLK